MADSVTAQILLEANKHCEAMIIYRRAIKAYVKVHTQDDQARLKVLYDVLHQGRQGQRNLLLQGLAFVVRVDPRILFQQDRLGMVQERFKRFRDKFGNVNLAFVFRWARTNVLHQQRDPIEEGDTVIGGNEGHRSSLRTFWK
jgi:hypothetical protein